jgi:hypothetical protein
VLRSSVLAGQSARIVEYCSNSHNTSQHRTESGAWAFGIDAAAGGVQPVDVGQGGLIREDHRQTDPPVLRLIPKDAVETELHTAVCNGTITLAQHSRPSPPTGIRHRGIRAHRY